MVMEFKHSLTRARPNGIIATIVFTQRVAAIVAPRRRRRRHMIPGSSPAGVECTRRMSKQPGY